jgi:hypothetical protein
MLPIALILAEITLFENPRLLGSADVFLTGPGLRSASVWAQQPVERFLDVYSLAEAAIQLLTPFFTTMPGETIGIWLSSCATKHSRAQQAADSLHCDICLSTNRSLNWGRMA